eukprot:TRINITY_DN5946_c0_g1_i5.p1 TRINITY_DN5946_c0_g1~~TRINITY_DN5946_c0_g1_i5.p1  ORF type:complete len:288 (-),score=-0.63 TRINITY_DN5946_c0_g1_i5:118-981(-)
MRENLMSGSAQKGVRWIFNFATWSPGPMEINRAFACIQAEEITRLLGFMYQADLKASLCGRLMLRLAVQECTGLKNNEIKLSRSERGRPYVIGRPEVNLNISHAGSYTILAAQINHSDNDLLGVDIMPLKDSRIERTQEFFRIMKRQFTDNEWITIKSWKTDEEQLACFYRHWALKESYVKAVGTGLNIDLRTIDFKIKSPLTPEKTIMDTEVKLDGKPIPWNFEESLIDNHCISVATNNHESMNVISAGLTFLNPKELVSDKLVPLNEIDTSFWELYSKKIEVKPF